MLRTTLVGSWPPEERVVGVDDVETAQVLPGFGEQAVGGQHLASRPPAGSSRTAPTSIGAIRFTTARPWAAPDTLAATRQSTAFSKETRVKTETRQDVVVGDLTRIAPFPD